MANTEEGTFRVVADRSTQRRMGVEVIMRCAVVGCFQPDFGGLWLILNQGKFQFHWALYPMQVYEGNEGWLSGQSSCTAQAEWQADSPTTVPSFSPCLHKVKNQAYVNAIVAHFSIACVSYQVSLPYAPVPFLLGCFYTQETVFLAHVQCDCLGRGLTIGPYGVNTLRLSFGSSL